ncbi:hypothetical protein [Bacillus cereus]|uniref:Uncharacterized protein n=1 Tax=Bacillus cereus MC67 TaxID=1053219 RepID=J8EDL3_BACCE|nr:hypothetical protein [Bacillus cereus]EJQ95076.1 hypothetical protein II3_04707 [Bacillus cereus MC67]EOP11212.1 hypothetical protein II1_03677 [Bacillus cereus MC118]
MKNIGAFYVLSGILLFGLTYITTAIYGSSLEIWDRPSGKFFTAFYEIHGTILSIISICFIIVGIYCIHKKV